MLARLTFLGCSAPYPGSEDLPAVVGEFGRVIALLDAGEGVQARLFKAGYSPVRITHILITHLHGDHVLGLVPLIQSMSLIGRDRPLHVIGPAGLAQYLRSSFDALYFDPPFDIEVSEVGPGDAVELRRGLSAVTGEARHTVPTLYYVIRRGHRALVGYVTDTRPPYVAVGSLKGVRVLIHDSAFSADDEVLARERYHSTTVEAAEIARLADAGMLVLYHISARYRERERLLREARRFFRNAYLCSKFMKVLV